MADNINVTPGAGKIIAADEVGGVLYQRMKVTTGADGAADDAGHAANPFRIDPTGTTIQPVTSPSLATVAANIHLPASNTAAVVTKGAAVGVSNVMDGVAWSYNGDPTAGGLTIEDGSGTTVFSIDITSKGSGAIYWPRPLKGTVNTDLIVTLAAGGSGVTGKLNLIGARTE